MHILLVADGRSPITQRWIQGLLALKHEVSLISTYPCPPLTTLRYFEVIPVAFSALGGGQIEREPAAQRKRSGLRKLVGQFRSIFLAGRYLLGPLTLPFYRARFRKVIRDQSPDLVHALRIPFEGMLASFTPPEIPLVISIWGNDLTLHGVGSAGMRSTTRKTLQRANGLMADAERDLRLARQWGFAAEKPALVVPGNGGIDLVEMHRIRLQSTETFTLSLPAGVPLVINPRGFRPGSVRNDVFFQAIPLILDRNPKVYFLCTAMADQPEALYWIKKLKIESNVRLLPYIPQYQLWNLFLRSIVSVSISAHDGTPNSLLEAMACGCFPIAGDIESLREWITPGINGYLVEPDKPQGVAEAILQALDHTELRAKAAEMNMNIIRERAEVNLVRSQIQVFYQRLIG